eukprot:15485336-Alexandrium_andersonii.AAC.1
MVQGRPDWRAVGPVWEHSIHLLLVHGSQRQGMELRGNPECHNGVPAPGQPDAATGLVAVAGPAGQ